MVVEQLIVCLRLNYLIFRQHQHSVQDCQQQEARAPVAAATGIRFITLATLQLAKHESDQCMLLLMIL